MAFTTVRGTDGRPDSFFGTSGVDTITLGALVNGARLGARSANDVVAFNSEKTGPLSGYTLNGGGGEDTFSSLYSTDLNRSQLLGDAGGDIFNLTGLTRSTTSGGQGSDQINITGLVYSSLINGNQDADRISINAGAISGSIFGGQGDDSLSLKTVLSTALVRADEGNDVLIIAAGTSLAESIVNGNQGNDTITVNAIATFTASTLFGGNGTDTINATNTTVGILAHGDVGNDNLTGGSGNDSLTGGSGDDNLTGGGGVDSFQVDSGVDAVLDLGTGGGDEIYDEIDVAYGATANATVTAEYTAQENSSNAGTLNATVAAALNTVEPISFSGLTGNGVNLTGNSFNLRLIGSRQSDTITGGSGVETLSGGLGNDQLTGGASGDFFTISAGADIITDVGGMDSILISAGATLLNGLIVTDWIAQNNGFNGNNGGTATLTSNAQGIDISVALSGGTAGWTLRGADVIGNGEVLTGSFTDDTLEGLAGDDTIAGGGGADNMTGGLGADQFMQANGNSVVAGSAWANLTAGLVQNNSSINFGTEIDVVTDFSSASDFLNADAAGATNAIGIDAAAAGSVGNFYVRGTYNGTTFTVNTGLGDDILFYVSISTDQTIAAYLGTTSIVLIGGAAGFNPATNIN